MTTLLVVAGLLDVASQLLRRFASTASGSCPECDLRAQAAPILEELERRTGELERAGADLERTLRDLHDTEPPPPGDP